MSRKKTDYEVELERIDEAIAGLAGGTLPVSVDSERATKSVYLSYQRASLTGNLADLGGVETALNQLIREIGPAGDLYFLKANLDFKFHRLADVRRALEIGRDPQNRLPARPSLPDLH